MTPNHTNLPDSSLYESRQHGILEYPVAVYHNTLDTFNMKYVPWHWHDEIEINIVIKGNAIFKANDDVALLTAGQAQFVNQNVLHSVRPSNGSDSCEFYSIVFHPAFLFGYGQTVMSSKYLTPILASEQHKHLILTPEIEWQKHILDTCAQLYEAQNAQAFGYELYVKEKLCSIWLEILKQFTLSEHAEHLSNKTPGNMVIDEIRVKKAILYMEQHHSETVTLDDIATAIHISKSECCRCFKRTLNLTPFEYLMRFRIFEATRKMQRQEPVSHSISALAFSVGFNNASYFNKLFKQYLQCTPKEYKKQLMNRSALTPTDTDNNLHYSPLDDTSYVKIFAK